MKELNETTQKQLGEVSAELQARLSKTLEAPIEHAVVYFTGPDDTGGGKFNVFCTQPPEIVAPVLIGLLEAWGYVETESESEPPIPTPGVPYAH